MARPKMAIRSVEKTLCLPAPLVDRVDLILFSELEGRVPFGAWKEFVVKAIENYLEREGGKRDGSQ